MNRDRRVFCSFVTESVGFVTAGSRRAVNRTFAAEARSHMPPTFRFPGFFALWIAAAVTVVAAPANDNFANAIPLHGAPASATGSNVGATAEPGEPNHVARSNGDSVWWSWVAPAATAVTIHTSGSNYDTLLAVYVGSDVGHLTHIASDDDSGSNFRTSRVTFTALAGQRYWIAVDGFRGATGSITLSVSTAIPAYPPYDYFVDSRSLVGNDVTFGGNNTGAGMEPGEPSHGGFGRSLWWHWVAPASGVLSLNVVSASYSPALRVYIGNAVNALSGVANMSGGWSVTAGITYRIAVDTANGGTGQIQLRLSLTTTPPPGNDAFANAILVAGSNIAGSGQNVGGTKEPGEPNHAGNAGGRSTWWRWVAPGRGTLLVTYGASFQPLVALYEGTGTLASLSPAPATMVNYSTTVFSVRTGATYWLAFDGAYGQGGSFGWNGVFTAAPANDDIAAATVLSGAGTLTGTNAGASLEPGEPAHTTQGALGGRSVWWQWLAPADGRVSISQSSGGFAVLAAYTGASSPWVSLVPVARAINSLTFDVTAGSRYWLTLDSYNGTGGPYSLAFETWFSPTLSLSVAGGSRVGETATIDITAADANGDLSRVHLDVVTPHLTYAVLPDSSLAQSNGSPSQATAPAAGSFSRTFKLAWGSGSYRFRAYASDQRGLQSAVSEVEITVPASFQGNPAADADGDGFGALAEHTFGLDATAFDGKGGPTGTLDNGEYVFRFNRAVGASDVRTRVLTTTDFTTWTEASVPLVPETSGPTLDGFLVRLPATSPRLFARLELSTAAGITTTVPIGYMRIPLAGGTLGAPALSVLSIPMDDPTPPPIGVRAGRIDAFTADSLICNAGGWTSNLANPTAPWMVRITRGAGAGKTAEIAANTATTLTLRGVTVTSLGVAAGVDTFELVPVDTLWSLFGADILTGGASAAAADQVQVRSGATWLAYYFDTTLGFWRRTIGPATNANNVRIAPQSGVQVLRRGPALSLTFTGRAPSLPYVVSVNNSSGTVIHTGFPVDTTLGALALHTLLPGWRSTALASTADVVSLFEGGTWTNFFHNGSQWRPVSGAAADSAARPIPAGTLIMIQRPGTATGTTDLKRPLPYSL